MKIIENQDDWTLHPNPDVAPNIFRPQHIMLQKIFLKTLLPTGEPGEPSQPSQPSRWDSTVAGKSGDLRLRLGSESKCAAQRHLAVERTKFSVSWIGCDRF